MWVRVRGGARTYVQNPNGLVCCLSWWCGFRSENRLTSADRLTAHSDSPETFERMLRCHADRRAVVMADEVVALGMLENERLARMTSIWRWRTPRRYRRCGGEEQEGERCG